MLLLTVFTSGAVLMAVEMIGSRILAPYFGNSIFVWGALIGVVLTALSIGYWAGGYWADRRPEPGPLAGILIAAGAWTWLLPSLAGRLTPWIAAAVPDPRSGALLASLGLLAGPALLMAMVSPWAVRLAAHELGRVGSTAGLLYAVSTAGSIAGTLVTSFYLIPAFGTADLTRGLGLLLTATGGVYGLRFGARPQAWAATGLTLGLLVTSWLVPPGSPAVSPPGDVPETAGGAAGSAAGPQEDGGAPHRGTGGTGSGSAGRAEPPPASGDEAGTGAPDDRDQAVGTVAGPFEDGVVYETDSLYHYIRVENRGGFRYLRFDNSWQSGMDLDDPVATVFEYTDYLLLP
ncbi:MAG TPA: fused MFS/spermidine synthase, partial [Bacillota bacterium]